MISVYCFVIINVRLYNTVKFTFMEFAQQYKTISEDEWSVDKFAAGWAGISEEDNRSSCFRVNAVRIRRKRSTPRKMGRVISRLTPTMGRVKNFFDKACHHKLLSIRLYPTRKPTATSSRNGCPNLMGLSTIRRQFDNAAITSQSNSRHKVPEVLPLAISLMKRMCVSFTAQCMTRRSIF